MSLRRSVISGSTWTVFGFGFSQMLRLVSNIALAALLYQEAFALMAIALAIIQGLAMFSDIGLAPSVIQNRRGDDRDFLNTAWTIQVLRGIGLTVIAVALAWPVASFYAQNDPAAWELLWLLPLVVLSTLVLGFQSSSLMTAARHINLARVTAIEVSGQIVTTSVMILCAWLTKSVYALAIGTVAGAITQCTLSHLLIPGPRNRFRWEPTALREIVHYGKWIFLSTLIFFFAMQLDKLLFARLFPLDQVGVYSIAASLAVLTPTLMGRLQSVVAFPLYSRVLDRDSALAPIVNQFKTVMLALGGYMVALSIAGAQTFVEIAYDERYADAGIFIPVLAAGAWFSILESIYGAAFLATGRSQWVALVNGTKVVTFCVLVYPLAHFGILGAIIAVVAADFVKAAVAIARARSIGLKGQLPDALYSLYMAAVGISVMQLSARWHALADMQSFARLGTQFVLVTLAFAPFLVRAARMALQQKSSRSVEVEQAVAAASAVRGAE